jgi:hypothetical protein
MIKFSDCKKQYILIHDEGFYIEFYSELDMRQFIIKQEEPQRYKYKYIEMQDISALNNNAPLE